MHPFFHSLIHLCQYSFTRVPILRSPIPIIKLRLPIFCTYIHTFCIPHASILHSPNPNTDASIPNASMFSYHILSFPCIHTPFPGSHTPIQIFSDVSLSSSSSPVGNKTPLPASSSSLSRPPPLPEKPPHHPSSRPSAQTTPIPAPTVPPPIYRKLSTTGAGGRDLSPEQPQENGPPPGTVCVCVCVCVRAVCVINTFLCVGKKGLPSVPKKVSGIHMHNRHLS